MLCSNFIDWIEFVHFKMLLAILFFMMSAIAVELLSDGQFHEFNLISAPQVTTAEFERRNSKIHTSQSLQEAPLPLTREYVISYFNTVWGRSAVPIEWTGDDQTCNVGKISYNFKLNVLFRLNWYRGMLGFPDMNHIESLDYQSQTTALVQSVNQGLTPYIDQSYNCFTPEAKEGSYRSILASGITGMDAITSLIDDPGADNIKVEHRMSLLSPDLSGTSIGAVGTSGGMKATLVMNVIDYIYTGLCYPRRDGFVAWPPPGYFPYPALPLKSNRWSFYPYNDYYDFTTATVTVVGPIGPLTSTIINRDPGDFGPYLVWENKVPQPDMNTGDTPYIVTISGIKGLKGNNVPPIVTYTVTILNIPMPHALSNFPTITEISVIKFTQVLNAIQ